MNTTINASSTFAVGQVIRAAKGMGLAQPWVRLDSVPSYAKILGRMVR